jgi:bacteriorhodopsin
LSRLLAWLSRHKSAAAGVVAAVVVWRVARNVIAGAWLIAGWDDIGDVGEWAIERWVWFALGLALVFAAVFLTVRALIPWLEERSRRAS